MKTILGFLAIPIGILLVSACVFIWRIIKGDIGDSDV